ncbi:MAG: hypothetical protein GC191_09215 [Azospirillum sp.]|nr:hypothetical protein [Azospirillum sp.]
MASRLFFNGRIYTTPTTVSHVNDEAMLPTGLTVGNILAIVGQCESGKPDFPHLFGSPSEVAATLGSGDLVTACQKAFDASSAVDSPSLVIGIRVGTPTQASLTLLDSGDDPAIDLLSDDYGLGANAIKVKVESGTNKGKKVTTQHGSGYYSVDDLERLIMSVRYSGAGPSATIAVANTAITLDVDGDATVISLDSYTTVQAVADRINVVPGFAATVNAGSGSKPTRNALDTVAATACKASAYQVTGTLQAVIDWINGIGEGYVTATRPSAAGLPPANINWTYLSGGANPAVINGDWSDAFTALQSVDCQWVVPLSGDPSIHAMADAHVAFMSTVARRERRAVVGPPTDTALADVLLLPMAINSDRTSLVWPGHYDYDVNGTLVLLPPWQTAVLVAAGMAGQAVGNAMTNKPLKIRGIETTVRNPTDTDLLIQAGVLAIEKTQKEYKVVRSISTWLDNDSYYRVEISCGAAADYVARSVRDALDHLRGAKASPLLLSRANAITETTLRNLAKPEPIGPAAIVGDASSPAYRGITSSITGDVLSVEFQCSPVIPANFITVSVNLVPYSGTASV